MFSRIGKNDDKKMKKNEMVPDFLCESEWECPTILDYARKK